MIAMKHRRYFINTYQKSPEAVEYMGGLLVFAFKFYLLLNRCFNFAIVAILP